DAGVAAGQGHDVPVAADRGDQSLRYSERRRCRLCGLEGGDLAVAEDDLRALGHGLCSCTLGGGQAECRGADEAAEHWPPADARSPAGPVRRAAHSAAARPATTGSRRLPCFTRSAAPCTMV